MSFSKRQTYLLKPRLILALFLATGLIFAVVWDTKASTQSEAEFKRLTEEISTPAKVTQLPSRAAAGLKDGIILMHLRNSAADATAEDLLSFEQEVAAGLSGQAFKLTTLRDLVGAVSLPSGGSLSQSLADSAVTSLAMANGIEHVLFTDINSLRLKNSEVAGRSIFNLALHGGLVLQSAAQGARLQMVTEQVDGRGFDASGLASKAFIELGSKLAAKAREWRVMPSDIKPIVVEIQVKVDGMMLPYLPAPDGVTQVEQVPLYAEGVAVELDGILLGNAPCRVEVWPGMHRLKIVHDSISTKESTVNFTTPTRYDLTITPSETARDIFNRQIVLMEQLRQQQREGRQRENLMKSEAEALRGLAAMLRQSGYRIDNRKIDDTDHLSLQSTAPEPKKP